MASSDLRLRGRAGSLAGEFATITLVGELELGLVGATSDTSFFDPHTPIFT